MMEEKVVVDYSIYSLGELQEIVGIMEDNPPDKRKKKEYQEYKNVMNHIFDIYNKKANFKTYLKIK